MTAAERADRTAAADAACKAAYTAAGAPDVGVVLVAVGGYGRGELAPFSDLDVVLVHDDAVDPGEIASTLWYPLWDAKYKVDHSVRSFTQMLDAARADDRVALGLLDQRYLCGDTHLSLRLRTALLADWRRTARERLRDVGAMSRRRHESVGELAHLSVPDLKESAGGLRDGCVLKAVTATWLVDVPTTDLERCRRALLDVRDHVHTLSGRAVDRIQPELWSPLAEALDLLKDDGTPDAEAAQRHVRSHGRRVAHLTRLTWRRVATVLDDPRPGTVTAPVTVVRGVAAHGPQVVLDGTVDPAADPVLLLRAAAVASEGDLALEPTTAAELLRDCPPLPTPWPVEARDLMVRLLAGRGLLGVWETLEETGALEHFLPEWEEIRLLPHASVIHRFTVDRHVVETCVEASKLIRRVERPDLLMVTALLHDIGKGTGLDHSIAGEEKARSVALRMGFSEADAGVVATLVRWHLLLPSVATGRDLDDPVTLEEVTSRITTPVQLELLAALTEADSLAASAKAWSSWRARLVGGLVARAAAVLGPTGAEERCEDRSDLPQLPQVKVPLAVRSGNQAAVVQVTPHDDGAGSSVLVLARDRVGLLADVAAALGIERISVRAARAWSQTEPDGTEWGVSEWDVDSESLDASQVRERFALVVAGKADTRRLERVPADALAPVVVVRPRASRSATVLEVRAGDRPGLLHQVLTAVAGLGMTVRSAHVDTVGPQAVDVFYLCELGAKALSETRAAEAAHAVRAVLSPTG
ncbi:[protein-PII] uridylyltransferase [Nocardioides yefusunii]|uniref:Bifunctional uridylyltransferase/uridylyl-removing enzyme n=1 Tax=Nocardioides yefusunii TaxID=2500546 RepID=A0ABW1QV89_9ACTN|nr:[protein-PII] uridylyltransferase [Nocardioides yefusunii]